MDVCTHVVVIISHYIHVPNHTVQTYTMLHVNYSSVKLEKGREKNLFTNCSPDLYKVGQKQVYSCEYVKHGFYIYIIIY